jgi:hypothetical protein
MVFPRVCSTDFTQIPIAADSRVRGVFFCPLRNLTVFLTVLMHRHKGFAKREDAGILFI